MYRIRFHGRGGQGMKTASRMLGSALFEAGYEVQDAPRYGAERRGAPIFAFVRADKAPINERGVINHPDLVLVADESLVGVPSAGVLQGISDQTVLFIVSSTPAEEWQKRLNTEAKVLTHIASETGERLLGAECIGAAARLLGCLDFEQVATGIETELADFGAEVVELNVRCARTAFDSLAHWSAVVSEGLLFHVDKHVDTDWIQLVSESIDYAAPAIHQGATSVQVGTGLWRTLRPVIEYDHCVKCNWVCSNYCPDNAITVNAEGYPEIDLNHCKGCMICVAQCPPHAIVSIAEMAAQSQTAQAS